MWGLAGGGVWALQWTRHMVDNTHKKCKKSAISGDRTKASCCIMPTLIYSAIGKILFLVRICIYHPLI